MTEPKAKLFPTKNLEELLNERKLGQAKKAEETPTALVETSEVAFKPCKAQRELKVRFYTAIKGLGIDISTLDVDTVDRYCHSEALYNWWGLPGFKEWFCNAETHKHKVRLLLERQIELLEEIQENAEGLYSVKDVLAAGKQILEYKKAFDDDEKSTASEVASDDDTIKRIAARMLEAKRLQKEKEPKQIGVALPS